MKQLCQKLKDGIVKIIEVPQPSLNSGSILVKNHYSLISSGTETSTVKTAQKGLIGKAKERPQQVKQVLDVLKQQGAMQTYRAVMKKLDSHSPLGYSSAGKVVEVSKNVTGFKIGDLVACGGISACHAEVVNVPVNLAVKLPEDMDLRQAAYNSLGSIAMQGIRQADLGFGETCGVIGLGLLGQLTCILLHSWGIRTIGVDIDERMVKIAGRHCVDLALERKSVGIEDAIMGFTGGFGCDGVIITAGSSSLDPINFGGAISKRRGTIVVVGAVPTGFDREPHFYKKELQVKMSCSYGPGRYDPIYEEKGIDYPVGYVRWTENRNMQEFQNLISSKRIDVSYLTTHTFKLEDSAKAYDMVLAKSEPFIGILIEYDRSRPTINEKIIINPQRERGIAEMVCLGFIGGGSYAQGQLLPNISRFPNISMKGVMTTSGLSSRSVAERFNFEFCTTDEKDILENSEIDTVFIATRHDSHAHYFLEALKAGKHVFVEKPLCLTIEQLEKIDSYLALRASKGSPQFILMVGYNRRFSPLIRRVKEEFVKGPMAITYRVNGGSIPQDSWVQDQEIGGGRIIGEVCHFVDTISFLAGSLPVSVYANAMDEPNNLNDTLNISLRYQNGSIGTISYFANGDKSLAKERIELFSNGATAIVDDFKRLTIYCGGKRKKMKLLSQDKGQKEEVKRFVEGIIEGKESPIPFNEIYNTSLVTFRIMESIRTGERVII